MSARFRMSLVIAALICGVVGTAICEAGDLGVRLPLRRARFYSWNYPYAHVQYGQPVALVVPPTANLQTNWTWGVGSSRVHRLDHQFGRNYWGPGPFGGPFFNTPPWPSDTAQFGVYHVRGPW